MQRCIKSAPAHRTLRFEPIKAGTTGDSMPADKITRWRGAGGWSPFDEDVWNQLRTGKSNGKYLQGNAARVTLSIWQTTQRALWVIIGTWILIYKRNVQGEHSHLELQRPSISSVSSSSADSVSLDSPGELLEKVITCWQATFHKWSLPCDKQGNKLSWDSSLSHIRG